MNGGGTINSIFDVDLSAKPGESYWTDGNRGQREESIYFLSMGRFHDDLERKPAGKPESNVREACSIWKIPREAHLGLFTGSKEAVCQPDETTRGIGVYKGHPRRSSQWQYL
ncbi:hypothetical protein [Dyadobacter pollutisoli]|uniref:Uncharacterized protein n=1 Tax=Dyadobacter pollutisoli TaxID=2910158 RepID=A0A9E8NCG5_9BACT|nr:hypothetical protein [Dyadobacter pollutisoli]WAC13463.1 hypothetical protein ON006_05795 [Dyadobacter pollutisoli]